METLRLGSKGELVKTLQKSLGVGADGVFGAKTEAALKAWQKSHGLVADGICGERTWKALVMQCDSRCVDSSVVYNPLNIHITKKVGREIKYLVIHFTAGSNSRRGRAESCKATFEKVSASADWAVDDEVMMQFNPDPRNYYCWAVGGSNYNNKGGRLYGKAVNSNCVSIEICSTCQPSTHQAVVTDNHKGWSFTDAVLEKARVLARLVMKKYGIPKDRVIRHYDVTGKLCPGIYGWNDEPIKGIDGKKTGEVNNSKVWEEWKKSL